MAAAYGVPLGGALFAVEVLRGALSLRLVLPAVATSLIATTVSWLVLPDAITYPIAATPAPITMAVWALLAGLVAGVVSVGYPAFLTLEEAVAQTVSAFPRSVRNAGYVRAVAWADHHKPKGRARLVAPTVVLGSLGLVSIWFAQLLGNGKDVLYQRPLTSHRQGPLA